MPDFKTKYQEFQTKVLQRKARWGDIRQLLLRLEKAHDWAETVDQQTNQKEFDRGMLKVETIYDDLEKLGVEKYFSAALFLFGPQVLEQPEMVTQF